MGAPVIKLQAENGGTIQFVDEVIGSGAMKDVYFSPDRSYVVAFFRDKLDFHALERLRHIVGVYREKIFTTQESAYWSKLFCWPTMLVKWGDRWGVVCPTYDAQFFFQAGNLKGKEKEGKWFASARNRNVTLPKEELADWRRHVQMCIEIARAVKRLHASGLAHSDLSYKNILVNPTQGRATLIDCDGLVVRGKFPPDVVGTPDFIAPEVVRTQVLPLGDPRKAVPSIHTDRHALAVLVYMYLLYRHPLRGGKVWHEDAAEDEAMCMGERALFVEHPTNTTNRPNLHDVHPASLPQADVETLPYTVCGKHLSSLFMRAFVEGLHAPAKRPTADEWEEALLQTQDAMIPCPNPQCSYKWFVFDGTAAQVCPFCRTPYRGDLPVLNFYYSPRRTNYQPENRRMVVHQEQALHAWHVQRHMSPANALARGGGEPLVTFSRRGGRWMACNQGCKDLHIVLESACTQHVAMGATFALEDNQKILLTKEDGGRLVVVQLFRIGIGFPGTGSDQ